MRGIGLFALATAAVAAPAMASDPIQDWCARQYPGDYELIERCWQKQRDAAQSIVLLGNYAQPDDPVQDMIEMCGRRYVVDGRVDTELANHCLDKQIEAYRQLNDGKAPWTHPGR